MEAIDLYEDAANYGLTTLKEDNEVWKSLRFGDVDCLVNAAKHLRGLAENKQTLARDFRSAEVLLSLVLNRSPRALLGDPGKSHQLVLPPGIKLRSFSEFVFTEKTYTQTISPTIDDIQIEYVEAVVAGCKWKARWVRIRGYLIWAKTIVVLVLSSTIVKLIRDAMSFSVGG